MDAKNAFAGYSHPPDFVEGAASTLLVVAWLPDMATTLAWMETLRCPLIRFSRKVAWQDRAAGAPVLGMSAAATRTAMAARWASPAVDAAPLPPPGWVRQSSPLEVASPSGGC